MTVSVVIAAYNPRAGDLERAVESVTGQTYTDWDCVVVDDGSGSENPIRIDHPRVRIVRQPNGGVSAARNRGVAETTGDLIAFLDQDDWWHREKLTRQVPFMAGRALALCDTDFQIKQGDVISPHGYNDHHGDFRRLLSTSRFALSTIIVRRDAFIECGGFNPLFPQVQDWEFGLRIGRTFPFDRLREVLATYTIHDENATADYKRTYSEQMAILDLYRRLDPSLRDVAGSGAAAMRALYSNQAIDAFRRDGKPHHLWTATQLSPCVLPKAVLATIRRRLRSGRMSR